VEPGTAVSFGSQHDADVMENFSKSGCDFFIQAIAVRSGEIQFTVYDYVRQIIFRDVEWEVMEPENEALRARLQREVAGKIKKIKPVKPANRAPVPAAALHGCPFQKYFADYEVGEESNG